MKHTHELRCLHSNHNKFKSKSIRLLEATLLFIIFFLIINNASANAAREVKAFNTKSITHGSTWLLPNNGAYIEALNLQSEVNIDVSGMIARATVNQRFRNTSSLWVEGLYVFPLPDNAAVDHFKLIIDGRIIEGKIKPKEQARKIYETAKRQGKHTGLLEQQRPNVFTTKMANIAPGAEIEVEIEYQQTLQYRDGQYSLRYPMVVGERYITVSKEGLGNPQYDTGVYTETSKSYKQLNATTITVNLDTGISASNIVSSSHRIHIDPLADHHYVVKLENEHVQADRDFTLSWTPELGKLPKAAVFNQNDDGYDYSLVTVYPPKNQLYNKSDIPREVVFILDISGSMAGTSIEQAKAALIVALNRLKVSDKFNIIIFNNIAKKIYFDSLLASNVNIKRAIIEIETLSANGGTEMLPALKLAFSPVTTLDYLRQLVFITDGNVSNERDLFNFIKTHLGQNRLFTIGIGSAPNSFFMKKAAKAGRGTYTFINNSRDVAKQTEVLFRKLESPALTDIQVTILGDEIETYQKPISDLYLGEPVSFVIKGKNINKPIHLKGKIGGNLWEHKIQLNDGIDNQGVMIAWANEKITSLSDEYHDEDDDHLKEHIRLQIIEASLRHHVLTQFTSLVAVDVTPVNLSGDLYSERIKNSLPHGWSRSQNKQAKLLAKQIYLPQTSTGINNHFILAVLLIGIAMAIRWMRAVQ